MMNKAHSKDTYTHKHTHKKWHWVTIEEVSKTKDGQEDKFNVANCAFRRSSS